jgi:two-component system sensor histidine kinase PilS (NtrC family)
MSAMPTEPDPGWPSPGAAGTGPDEDSAFQRLWRGFMAARVGIALVLTVLLGALHMLGLSPTVDGWQVGLCATYFAAALAVRMFTQPEAPGRTFDPQWVSTIGIDLLAFATLHFLQVAGLNFSPLFALPVLTASVLGSALLALGTAAAVTLLLLVDAWVSALQGDYAPRFVQAGLAGGGFFAVALLANQLSARLEREEAEARSSKSAARTQAHVNELVIETLSEGVLVVASDCTIHAANPAARVLLGWQAKETPATLALASRPGWRPLVTLAQRTFQEHANKSAELVLELSPGEKLYLQVRTRLTPPQDLRTDALCVMFLQDLREAEARLRTEKLAAMGRMSAAVAHEIRNPLAAIAQANALLAEELGDPGQKQLTALVGKNAQRLAQIVEEILNIARVQQEQPAQAWLELDPAVQTLASEWQRHVHAGARLLLLPAAPQVWVAFDGEHLRRVLVNLLDNALRYASPADAAMVVATEHVGDQAWLRVWSDGAPLDASVQRHLFEPFFSSESRSSGLGLYICRELCTRYGATILYRRHGAPDGSRRDGNEFSVGLKTRASVLPASPAFDTIGG